MYTFQESNKPTKNELEEMFYLYDCLENVSVHQLPESNLDSSIKRFFFIKDSQRKIKAYCITRESCLNKLKFIKTAKVYFGVISLDDNLKKKLLNYVVKYYKLKKFAEIYIYYLNETFDYDLGISNYKLDNLERGTLLIDLELDLEEIKSYYSKHLKRNLNKGQNLNLNVKKLGNDNINEAFEIYKSMSNKRQIDYFNKTEFTNYFIYSLKNGLSLGCFFNGKLIGGMLCLIQGERIEYFIGFTDPEYKHLPQSHLTFDTAIKLSKKSRLKYFDMGGAISNIDENTQIYKINKFKMGFTKEFKSFQPSEKIILNKSNFIIKLSYLKINKILIR